MIKFHDMYECNYVLPINETYVDTALAIYYLNEGMYLKSFIVKMICKNIIEEFKQYTSSNIYDFGQNIRGKYFS